MKKANIMGPSSFKFVCFCIFSSNQLDALIYSTQFYHKTYTLLYNQWVQITLIVVMSSLADKIIVFT